MRNERLRALLLERGKSPDQLAEHVRVDAKTVERWITRGRLPYRRHRFEVATFLGVNEAYIWPDALGKDEIAAVRHELQGLKKQDLTYDEIAAAIAITASGRRLPRWMSRVP